MSRGATANVHATCVRVARAGEPFGVEADAGILLLGGSGAGKSDVALRLIALGAELVADDRVDLYTARGALRARVPRTLAGLLEVRGVGIVEVPYTDDVRVAVAVRLAAAAKSARLPEPAFYQPPDKLGLPAGAHPPLLQIASREASAEAKILAALAAFRLARRRKAVKPR